MGGRGQARPTPDLTPGRITQMGGDSTLPRFNVHLEGRPAQALMDTGANGNFVRADLAQGYPLSPGSTVIAHATGKGATRTKGSCVIPTKIQGHLYQIRYEILEELIEEVILGYPWLKENQATIDVTRGCLYVGTNPRLTVYCEHRKASEPKDVIRLSLQPDQLPSKGSGSIVELVQGYADVFQEDIRQPTTRSITHSIKLTSNETFR